VLRRIKETPANADYPWDVLVGGNDTLMFNLKDLGVLQAPIDEALILPGVKDPSKWSGGSLPYIDSGRSGLALLKQAGQYFYVDTSRAKPEDIKSYRDLLDPRWRGQMVMSGDPRDPGHGRSVFAFFLAAPGLGADFVRDLVTKQELIIPKDNTQDADRILKGEAYAMCICNNAQGADLLDSGRPFAKLDPHKVKEGTSVTSSFSNLTLPKRQAHPNAAKVYANWLLSAETGLAISQATKIASTRADVTKDHVPAQSIPDPSWPSGSDESALKGAEEAQRLAVELLGPKEGGGRRR
jgi:iron(III) transport system substrate-binding protein